MGRSSDYWSEYTDEDLEYLRDSHEANMDYHGSEMRRINEELQSRKIYDFNTRTEIGY